MKYKEIKITEKHKVYVPLQDKFTEDLLRLSSLRHEHYAMYGKEWKDMVRIKPLEQKATDNLEDYLNYLEGIVKIMR